MKIRFFVYIFFSIVSYVNSHGKIKDGYYTNGKVGISIKVVSDSVYFYKEDDINILDTKLVAKGVLNELNSNLYKVQQTPVAKQLFERFEIQENSDLSNDSVNLTFVYPGLKDVDLDLTAVLNDKHESPISKGTASFKLPFSESQSCFAGLYGNCINDKVGNSYCPILVYSDEELIFDQGDKTIIFPNVTLDNLRQFDINDNYIELLSPNAIKWKSCIFVCESDNGVSLRERSVKHRIPKSGYYSKVYDISSINDSYNFVDFINATNNYDLSFVLDKDSIKLYVDRDWVVDGSVFDFLYSENYIGKGKLRPINNNYYEIDVQSYRERVIDGLTISAENKSGNVIKDSVDITVSCPNLTLPIWMNPDTLTVSFRYCEKIYSSKIATSNPECVFRLPARADSIDLIINPYQTIKPSEHLKNIFPPDFIRIEIKLPHKVDDIKLTLNNLKSDIFDIPIDFKGEYFEVLTPTKIKWRDQIFELNKKGSKLYKKYKNSRIKFALKYPRNT